ncbi:MAG: KH domain-containing protein [Candidatus Andersenbacteria bacterium]|nr:KH domain-containing protein [Candidatus Andersenbacteria bacterium]
MDDRPSHDQEFVEYVVKSIVDHPDDVKLERTIDEMGVLITLSVNPEDMGQIIGRQGATAKSIRTLLRVIGARNNARVNLKVKEPEGSTRGQKNASPAPEAAASPEAPAAEAPKQSVEEAIDDLNL